METRDAANILLREHEEQSDERRGPAPYSAVFPAHGEIPSLLISEALRRARSAAELIGGADAIIVCNLYTQAALSRVVILTQRSKEESPAYTRDPSAQPQDDRGECFFRAFPEERVRGYSRKRLVAKRGFSHGEAIFHLRSKFHKSR